MISRDDWLAAVADVTRTPDVDPAAITIAEFAEMVGVRRTAAKDRMQALVKAGRARKVAKQIRDTAGRQQTIPAYVLIQEAPDAVARLQHTRRRPGR